MKTFSDSSDDSFGSVRFLGYLSLLIFLNTPPGCCAPPKMQLHVEYPEDEEEVVQEGY